MPPAVVGTGLRDVDPIQGEGRGVPVLAALLEPAEPGFAVGREDQGSRFMDHQQRAVKSTPVTFNVHILDSPNVQTYQELILVQLTFSLHTFRVQNDYKTYKSTTERS